MAEARRETGYQISRLKIKPTSFGEAMDQIVGLHLPFMSSLVPRFRPGPWAALGSSCVHEIFVPVLPVLTLGWAWPRSSTTQISPLLDLRFQTITPISLPTQSSNRRWLPSHPHSHPSHPPSTHTHHPHPHPPHPPPTPTHPPPTQFPARRSRRFSPRWHGIPGGAGG